MGSPVWEILRTAANSRHYCATLSLACIGKRLHSSRSALGSSATYYSLLIRTIRLHTKASFSPVTPRQDWRRNNRRCSPVSVVSNVARLNFIIENQNQILGKLNSPKDWQFRPKGQKSHSRHSFSWTEYICLNNYVRKQNTFR